MYTESWVQVDRLIGQNHLFKRSVILVKAWCYYESRILGAHHGLISTYALETLVLYIFHVFHSSLRGPLEVSIFLNGAFNLLKIELFGMSSAHFHLHVVGGAFLISFCKKVASQLSHSTKICRMNVVKIYLPFPLTLREVVHDSVVECLIFMLPY